MSRIFRPMVARQTFRDGAFLLLGLPLSVTYFTLFVTLYCVGFATVIIWVGVPLLMLTHALLRPVGLAERGLANRLLRAEVDPPMPFVIRRQHLAAVRNEFIARTGDRWFALVHDGQSWRILVWILVRIVTGPVGFSIAIAWITVSVSLLLAPVGLLFPWETDVDAWWRYFLLLGPVALLFVGPALAWAVSGLGTLHRVFARWALGRCDQELAEVAVQRANLAEEQVRIDQELHDSIGHMVSMIVVQAGAGKHVFESDPEFARRALGNIESRGRAALGELDRIIARIRGDQPESHTPLPGAADLPALFAGAREAGVAVEASVRISDDAPPALGRGIYRVVQEALTNAAKHAPGSPVDVVIAGDGEVVAVSVENAASPDAGDGGRVGNGLAGIRDRVALLGGRAVIGRTPRGRFAVRAVLPVGAMLPEGANADCTLRPNCRCLCCGLTRKARA